eukprot:scaffold4625_cov115-Isochrysis_galbana.AAC.1
MLTGACSQCTSGVVVDFASWHWQTLSFARVREARAREPSPTRLGLVSTKNAGDPGHNIAVPNSSSTPDEPDGSAPEPKINARRALALPAAAAHRNVFALWATACLTR